MILARKVRRELGLVRPLVDLGMLMGGRVLYLAPGIIFTYGETTVYCRCWNLFSSEENPSLLCFARACSEGG